MDFAVQCPFLEKFDPIQFKSEAKAISSQYDKKNEIDMWGSWCYWFENDFFPVLIRMRSFYPMCSMQRSASNSTAHFRCRLCGSFFVFEQIVYLIDDNKHYLGTAFNVKFREILMNFDN